MPITIERPSWGPGPVTISNEKLEQLTDYAEQYADSAAEDATAPADASISVKGIVKLSVAPAVAAQPKVVGDNDPRVTAFAGSGSGHRAGLVPDPGATVGTARFLREDGAFAAPALPYSEVTLPDGSTITLDADVAAPGVSFKVTLAGNRALHLTHGAAGKHMLLEVTQGAGGSHTLSFETTGANQVLWPGGTAPTLSTAVGKSDLLGFRWSTTQNCWLGLPPALAYGGS